MRCKLRKSVKRVVSAGVNAEGSVEASWLRAQEEEVFGARSGADGQKAADRGGTVSRCGVNTGHRPRTSSSTARNLRSARLFHGTVFRQCVGRSKQAYKILRYLSDLFFIVLYSNGQDLASGTSCESLLDGCSYPLTGLVATMFGALSYRLAQAQLSG